jgi:anti-anti-sigma factor
MAAHPVIFATGPYTDNARRIMAPESLLHGEEHALLPFALPALQSGDLDLDLCELEQIDAAGLGMLAMLQAFARKSGHTLRLLNPSPRIWKLLSLTRLDAVFTATVNDYD